MHARHTISLTLSLSHALTRSQMLLLNGQRRHTSTGFLHAKIHIHIHAIQIFVTLSLFACQLSNPLNAKEQASEMTNNEEVSKHRIVSTIRIPAHINAATVPR